MKHLIIIISATLGITFSSLAQTGPVLHFYNKYKEMDHVRDVRLQGWVLKLASEFSDEASGDQLLQKISYLRVLIMEEGNLVSPQDYRRLMRDVKNEAFEELFKVKDGDDHVDFLIREKGGTITDVLVAISGSDGFILLSLEGRLQFSDLNDLNIEVEGAEHFKKLPEKREKIPQA